MCATLVITVAPILPSTIDRSLSDVVLRQPITTARPNLEIGVVAHRGASKFAPENTLAAFRKAVAMGVEYIELDIRLTRDGEPVILHDSTVDRTTNGTGYIADMTLAEARALDAGTWFSPAFADLTIPTLDEALQIMANNVCVFWDTKAIPSKRIIATFQKYGFDRDCLVITYSARGPKRRPKSTRRLLSLWPDAPIMPLVKKAADIQRILENTPQARAVIVMRNHLSVALIEAAHKEGLLVATSTLVQVDTPKHHRTVINSGADLIMLDNIDDFHAVLNGMKEGN
jgi:glycerophosphoryl diester phosphodiesterase